jgi:hypothetical protein
MDITEKMRKERLLIAEARYYGRDLKVPEGVGVVDSPGWL